MEDDSLFTARVSARLLLDDDPESSLRGRAADGKLNRPPASILRTFPTLEESSGIWPVRIQTLGVFSLTLNRKAVSLDSDSVRQVLEFLKALIAFGGLEVSTQNLASALWPQIDRTVAQRSVDAMLRNLRDILGEECVLVSPDGGISLVPDYCWVDVWEFERTLAVTRRILNRDFTGKDASRLELLSSRLRNLYQGHFMTGEDATSWSVSRRERLRIRFITHLLDAGRFWESRGLWDRAIACYQQGLQVDDLVEDFYQRLMVCHLVTQRISEGLSVYLRCRNVLSTILGLQPAAETEALYNALARTIQGKNSA
ncbi:MAG: bacterial transcriptional activator domain-containing protein [Gammaproteobacteria bacterium]